MGRKADPRVRCVRTSLSRWQARGHRGPFLICALLCQKVGHWLKQTREAGKEKSGVLRARPSWRARGGMFAREVSGRLALKTRKGEMRVERASPGRVARRRVLLSAQSAEGTALPRPQGPAFDGPRFGGLLGVCHVQMGRDLVASSTK